VYGLLPPREKNGARHNQKITISENFQKSRSPKIQIVARNLEPIAPQQGALLLVTIGDKAARLVLETLDLLAMPKFGAGGPAAGRATPF
jgi:hypothetical protein